APREPTCFPTRRSSDLNSRDRYVKFRGVISFLKLFPTFPIPNGTRIRLVSTTFSNCTNTPCAVSGRRYTLLSSLCVSPAHVSNRSEEHTSELQSRENLV